jgi:hypothetical protein
MEYLDFQHDGLSEDFENLNTKDNGEGLGADLLQQCQCLLDELEQFQEYLVEQKKESSIELRNFKNTVKAEFNSLEKVCHVIPC